MPPELPTTRLTPEVPASVSRSSMWRVVAVSAIAVILIVICGVAYAFVTLRSQPNISSDPSDFSTVSLVPTNAVQEQQFDANGTAVVNAGPTSQFTDSKTGISFSYPAEWGRVEIADERGECPAGTQDPCNQRIYLFPDLAQASIFLTTETKGHQEHPIGRGGFWGDGAGGISASLIQDCPTMTNCTLIQNPEGTRIAKRMGVFEFGDDDGSVTKKIAYYVSSNKGPYYGMILTASRFSQPGDAREKQFEEVLIASLKLSAH